MTGYSIRPIVHTAQQFTGTMDGFGPAFWEGNGFTYNAADHTIYYPNRDQTYPAGTWFVSPLTGYGAEATNPWGDPNDPADFYGFIDILPDAEFQAKYVTG